MIIKNIEEYGMFIGRKDELNFLEEKYQSSSGNRGMNYITRISFCT